MPPFTEALKQKIRDRADLRCCIAGCHKPDIDIHHIEPRAAGGDSTEDNAAPLCAGCHRAYGGDPTKRKMIREHRDRWYRTVAGEAPGAVVRASSYVSFGNCYYSFVRDEFIHPLILRELPRLVVRRGRNRGGSEPHRCESEQPVLRRLHHRPP